jgi:hypothetical protein
MNIRHFILIMLLAGCSYAAEDDGVNVNVRIKNKLTNQPSNSSCRKCSGKKLAECILCTPAHHRIEEIRQLPSRKIKELLLNVDDNEYKELLENMTEEDWGLIRESLPEEWQETAPQTVEEQLEQLKSIIRYAERIDGFINLVIILAGSSTPLGATVIIGGKCLGSIALGNPITNRIKMEEIKKYTEKNLP